MRPVLVTVLAGSLALLAQAPPPPPPAPPAPPAPPTMSRSGDWRTERRVEPLASGSKLWVRNRNGFLKVTGTDREEVALQAEIRDTESRKVSLVVTRKGPDLDIEAQFLQPAFRFGFSQSPRCDMTLRVPRRLLGHFRTVNGSVDVNAMDGYVRAETTNGHVEVEEVAGEVHVETTNGHVELRRLKARVKAETTNGRITLEDVEGGIRAETTNGRIEARRLDGWDEGIRLETTNGSLEVELGKAAGEVEASNTHGSIDSEVRGSTVLESSKHHLRLKVPGRSQKITLETTNGSITIR